MSQTAILNVTIKAVKDHVNIDYVIKFLKGLNESFSQVKSQILLMKPLPSIDEVFFIVLQHERQSKPHALNVNIGMNSFMPGNANIHYLTKEKLNS